ncbi:MAG: LytTR family transcriptional regulator [Bacteroidetes bacterium]|nr:LytTR family transcriptional regulator [Bacteroidota bacterium]
MIRFEADGRYSTVFLAGSRKIVVSKNLAEYEELLGGRTFFRTHNSHLVNLEHVRKIVKTEGGYMEMSDGSTVDISRRRKDELLKQMSALSKGIKS